MIVCQKLIFYSIGFGLGFGLSICVVRWALSLSPSPPEFAFFFHSLLDVTRKKVCAGAVTRVNHVSSPPRAVTRVKYVSSPPPQNYLHRFSSKKTHNPNCRPLHRFAQTRRYTNWSLIDYNTLINDVVSTDLYWGDQSGTVQVDDSFTSFVPLATRDRLENECTRNRLE